MIAGGSPESADDAVTSAEDALRCIHLGLLDGLQLLELVYDLMEHDVVSTEKLREGLLASRLAIGGVTPHLLSLIVFVGGRCGEASPAGERPALNS